MAETQNCSVGISSQTKCHQKIFTDKTRVVNIMNTFRRNEIEILKLRSGKMIDSSSTICEHHRWTFFEKYPLHKSSRLCCDPQKSHRKPVRVRLHEIPSDFAKTLFEHCEIQLIPGQKLCSNCRQSLKDQIEFSKAAKKKSST
jgi:hypothetical protein